MGKNDAMLATRHREDDPDRVVPVTRQSDAAYGSPLAQCDGPRNVETIDGSRVCVARGDVVQRESDVCKSFGDSTVVRLFLGSGERWKESHD